MVRRSALLGCALLWLACGGAGEPDAAAGSGGEGDRTGAAAARGIDTAAGRDRSPAPRAADGEGPVVLFFGTSLTAGYGLDDPELAFPDRVGAMLDSAGLDHRVVEAGVPGETSAAGVRRIGWVLDASPADVVVVELGGNDGLRGLDPGALRRNLEAVVDTIRRRRPGARVILAGMEAPPNLGPRYTEAFRRAYREVAEEKGAALLPFLLEGVAGVPGLNQDDGIHPNARGHRRVAENVWRVLEPELRGGSE